MPNPKPANQVCPICAHDDDIEVVLADGDWVMICSSRSHPMYEWRPKEQYQKSLSPRFGIAEELGVYDDLLHCVHDGFAEYGIVEYRYWEHSPDTYMELANRYGHTALGPGKYTVSAFLGGALGQLWRENLVVGRWGPATGYWAYNGTVGAYGPSGTPEKSSILSWESFARTQLGVDPMYWPPLKRKKAY